MVTVIGQENRSIYTPEPKRVSVPGHIFLFLWHTIFQKEMSLWGFAKLKLHFSDCWSFRSLYRFRGKITRNFGVLT